MFADIFLQRYKIVECVHTHMMHLGITKKGDYRKVAVVSFV